MKCTFKTKWLAAALCVFCIITVCSACSKDATLSLFHNAIESIGKIAVTSDSRLKGQRQKGSDSYTGTYTAEYIGFSQTEFPFGGTSLKEDGRVLYLRCTLHVNSGGMTLFFSSLGEETVLASESGVYTFPLKLPAGANYIGLRGHEFTGSIQIEVAQQSPGESLF